MLAVGPAADLDAHGDGHGPDHGLDDPPDGRRVGQQRPALAAVQQTPDGALEIEIDDVEAELLDDSGGGGHHGRLGAADLARPRGLGRRGAQRPHRPAIAPNNVRGIDPLAARQACAEALHQPAKTGVAVLFQRQPA